MDLRRVESEQEYVGRVLEFRVTKYGENGRNIVVSKAADPPGAGGQGRRGDA